MNVINWEKSKRIASQIDPHPNQCYFNAAKGISMLSNKAIYVEGFFVYLDVRKGKACAWEHGWTEEDGQICEFSPDCWPGECKRVKYFPVRKFPKRHVIEAALDIWHTYETGEGNLDTALSLIPYSRILKHAVGLLRNPDRDHSIVQAWIALLQMQEKSDPKRRRDKAAERGTVIHDEAQDKERHRQAIEAARAYYKKLRGIRGTVDMSLLPWP
jgi:hypothetical protein